MQLWGGFILRQYVILNFGGDLTFFEVLFIRTALFTVGIKYKFSKNLHMEQILFDFAQRLTFAFDFACRLIFVFDFACRLTLKKPLNLCTVGALVLVPVQMKMYLPILCS